MRKVREAMGTGFVQEPRRYEQHFLSGLNGHFQLPTFELRVENLKLFPGVKFHTITLTIVYEW